MSKPSLLAEIHLSDSSDDETASTQHDEPNSKKRNVSEVTTGNQPEINAERGEKINLPEEELKVTKRQRHKKPFDEDLLVSSAGLARIYQEFPKACKYHGRGSEGKYLQRLITMYKEWAFQLHPGLSFQDIISRLDALGSKGKVRSYMEALRNIEKDRYTNEVLLPMAEKDSSLHQKLNKQKKKTKSTTYQATEKTQQSNILPNNTPSRSTSVDNEEEEDFDFDSHDTHHYIITGNEHDHGEEGHTSTAADVDDERYVAQTYPQIDTDDYLNGQNADDDNATEKQDNDNDSIDTIENEDSKRNHLDDRNEIDIFDNDF